MGQRKRGLKGDTHGSMTGVANSKACKYGLSVARSSIGRGPGDWIFFIPLSLLVDCTFQSLCQEDKINDR